MFVLATVCIYSVLKLFEHYTCTLVVQRYSCFLIAKSVTSVILDVFLGWHLHIA